MSEDTAVVQYKARLWHKDDFPDLWEWRSPLLLIAEPATDETPWLCWRCVPVFVGGTTYEDCLRTMAALIMERMGTRAEPVHIQTGTRDLALSSGPVIPWD